MNQFLNYRFLTIDDKIIFDFNNECQDEMHSLFTKLDNNNEHLLKHPLIEAFLSAKWLFMRKYYIANVILVMFFMSIFTLMVQCKATGENQCFSHHQHELFCFGYAVTCFKVCYLIGKELMHIFALTNKSDYITWDNLMDWAVIIPTTAQWTFLQFSVRFLA